MLLKAIRCALWLALCHGAPGAPIISEFQAANTATIRDEEGEASDWLEIFNPDDAAADLSGMALTDDPAQLRKWIFPAISLPPRATLLVWCSGKNRIQPGAALHTNFKLGAEGGFLALTDRDGVIGPSIWNPYPPQVEDRSYGLMFPVTGETVIAGAAPCRWRIPVVDIPDWQQVSFDDTTWSQALTGIGYDRVTNDGNFLPLLGAGGNVENVMFGVRSTCLIRIPFSLAKPEDVITLTLRAKFDDGFAAWLNGTRLDLPAGLTNVPAVVGVGANSLTARTNPDALVFQSFSLNSQTGLLREGQNVLAIHLLNQSPSSSDALFLPELDVTKIRSDRPLESGFFAVPTPGSRNNAAPVQGFVRPPVASVGRGFFSAPVTLSFSSETPGAVIRYTTDGSAPGPASGIVAASPLTLTTNQVVRAAAFLPGWEPSPVLSHTYLFPALTVNQPAAPSGFPSTWGNEYNYSTRQFSGSVVPADYRMDPGVTADPVYSNLMIPALATTLPVISLSGNTTEIFGTASGIYANGRQDDELELKTSMEFWDPSGGGTWHENAGLRIHGGNAAMDHPKKPFRVYFRRDYGNGRLRQPVFPGSPVTSFDKLQLRPGGHDGWAVPFGSGDQDLARHASYCRDRFLRQTELDMGRMAPRGRYVHLYLNALYWGVYDLHEVPSKEMYSDHLGGAESDWDAVEHPGAEGRTFDTVDGTDAALTAALALLPPTPQEAGPGIYNALADLLIYPEFIDYLIVQMWGAQNDWMGPVFLPLPNGERQDASYFFNKNWQAGRRSRGSTPTGFFWHNWDAEISMGSSLNINANMRNANFNHTLIGTPDEEIDRRSGDPGPPALIYHALRKNSPRFRLLFADRLQRHFFNAGAMTIPANLTRLQNLRDQLDLPLVAESARWGDVNKGNPDNITFTRDLHWRSEMDWMRDTYLQTRNNTLISQFAEIGLWPAVPAPVYAQHGGSIVPGYQLSITHPGAAGGSCYFTTDGSDPARVELDAPVPSPSALLYTAPLSLNRSTVVKARVFHNNVWSPLTEAFFSVGVPASSANLIISELNYNPVASPAEILAGFTSQQFEFLELLNTSGSVIDLSGCRFAHGIAFDFLPAGNWMLAPGARLVLASHAGAFAMRYHNTPVAGSFAAGTNLSNGGERLTLVDASNAPIFDFVFDDDPPWPGAADGIGYSLVLKRAEARPDPATPGNWRAGPSPGGTPGGTDADSFAAWAARSGISGGALDDDSSNGVPNLIEYALGLPPAPLASGALFTVQFETPAPGAGSGRYAVMESPARLAADDVKLSAEMSADLRHWTPLIQAVPPPTVPESGIGAISWRSSAPVVPQANIFFRLRVAFQ